MYRLHRFIVAMAPISILCFAHASSQNLQMLNLLAQTDSASSNGFSSKPAGSTPIQNPTQAPLSNPGAFQTKASATSSSHNPAQSPPVVVTAVAAPPMSNALANLVKARDQKVSMADRRQALLDAEKEIAKLPLDDQAKYALLVSATGQRIFVDEFLLGAGPVQGSVPAQAK